MKKPKGYFGLAWAPFEEGRNKKWLKTKSAQKERKDYNTKMKAHRKHYKNHGWDPTETWNLDITIAKFVLPRLKYLKENTHGYPASITSEEWDGILSKIILMFSLTIEENIDNTEESAQQAKEGLQLFAEYYRHLWD